MVLSWYFSLLVCWNKRLEYYFLVASQDYTFHFWIFFKNLSVINLEVYCFLFYVRFTLSDPIFQVFSNSSKIFGPLAMVGWVLWIEVFRSICPSSRFFWNFTQCSRPYMGMCVTARLFIKISFFEFIENLVNNFSWISSIIKVPIICYIPA